jgi:hypothetical protein
VRPMLGYPRAARANACVFKKPRVVFAEPYLSNPMIKFHNFGNKQNFPSR